jgi:hypothetical protein
MLPAGLKAFTCYDCLEALGELGWLDMDLG